MKQTINADSPTSTATAAELRRYIDQLEARHQTVLDERDMLKTVIKNLPGHILVQDQALQPIISNHPLPKFEDEELSPCQTKGPQQQAQVQAILAGEKSKITHEVPYQLNGEKRWLLTTRLPLHNENNQIMGLITICKDITPRKRAQKALQEQHEFLEELVSRRTKALTTANNNLHQEIARREQMETEMSVLLNNANQAFVLLDDDYHVRVANKVAQEDVMQNFGILLENGTNILTCVLPKEKTRFIENFQQVLRGKNVKTEQSFEINQKTYWYEYNFSPVFTKDKQTDGCCLTWANITDRKSSEEKLRLLEAAVVNNTDGIAIIDVRRQDLPIIYVNPGLERNSGYKAAELLGQPFTMLYRNNSDQTTLPRLKQVIKQGKQERLTLMARCKNNDPLWSEITIYPLYSRDKELTHCVTIQRDVSAYRQKEEMVNLLSTAVSGSMDGVTISDPRQPDNPLIYVNPSMERMTGYRAEEVLGSNCRFLQGNDRDQPGIAKLRQAVKEGKQCRVVLRNYRKNGSLFWNELTIYPLFDVDGNLTHFVGIQHNITATKQFTDSLYAIYQLGRKLTLLYKEAAIFHQVLSTLIEIVDADAVYCFLLDDAGSTLKNRYALNNNKVLNQPDQEIGLNHVTMHYLEAKVVTNAEAILVANTKQSYQQSAFVDMANSGSLLMVPMSTSSQVTGILCAVSQAPNKFKDADQQIVQTLADQVTVALENAQLHLATEHIARQLAALNKAIRAMTSSLDLQSVLQQITAEIKMLFNAEGASVLLLEPDQQYLRFVAVASPNDRAMQNKKVPVKNSIAGWSLENNRSVLLQEPQKDSRFYPGIDQATKLITTDLIAVPLIYQNNKMGVIEAINKQQENFTPGDLDMLESIASTAASAIENARLYEAEREHYRHLQQSQAQLVQFEKMAALGRLVASIAHEINNPLQSIQSGLTLIDELLHDEQLDRDSMHLYLNITGDEIERIATIVKRMRDFYRTSSHTKQILGAEDVDDFYHSMQEDLSEIDIEATLDSVLLLANKYSQHSGVTVKQQWANTLPPVWANANFLRQVFLNLILNAIDAMAEEQSGELTISTHLAELQHPTKPDREAVLIKFADNGIGMTPETLSRIFEPMFTTKKSGSGFGLYTSYKIIEAHNGQITATSQPGQGTTFSIYLPTASPAKNVSSQ